MIIALRGPEWLYGLDAIVQFVVAFIAILVAYYGYKTYKICKDKKFLYFSSAFALLGLALLVFAIIIPSLYIYYNFYIDRSVGKLIYISRILNFSYISATLMAYTFLIFIYAKIKRKGIKILLTLLVLSLATHSFITISFLSFNLIAILLLIFIILYTGRNYLKKKNLNSFLAFLIFILIGVSHLLFILGLYSNNFFLFAHLVQLIGYSSLFILFMRVNYGNWKKGQIPNNR